MNDSDRKPALSVVVPTRNEATNIERCIDDIVATSPLPTDQLEIAVVDESTDDTAKIARNVDHSCVCVYEFEGLGLARSVVAGFERTTERYIGVIDADGQHPPSMLFDLFESLQSSGSELAVASRYTDGGVIRNWSPFRKVVSVGATILVRWTVLIDEDIRDPLSGLFVVDRELIAGVDIDPVGYKLLLEIMVKSDPETYVEVPYRFRARKRGNSSLSAEEYVDFLVHVSRLLAYRLAGRGAENATASEVS
jgi:dolichol-phosphate mannosyltransferase